eukprot:Opistho-2@68396
MDGKRPVSLADASACVLLQQPLSVRRRHLYAVLGMMQKQFAVNNRISIEDAHADSDANEQEEQEEYGDGSGISVHLNRAVPPINLALLLSVRTRDDAVCNNNDGIGASHARLERNGVHQSLRPQQPIHVGEMQNEENHASHALHLWHGALIATAALLSVRPSGRLEDAMCDVVHHTPSVFTAHQSRQQSFSFISHVHSTTNADVVCASRDILLRFRGGICSDASLGARIFLRICTPSLSMDLRCAARIGSRIGGGAFSDVHECGVLSIPSGSDPDDELAHSTMHNRTEMAVKALPESVDYVDAGRCAVGDAHAEVWALSRLRRLAKLRASCEGDSCADVKLRKDDKVGDCWKRDCELATERSRDAQCNLFGGVFLASDGERCIITHLARIGSLHRWARRIRDGKDITGMRHRLDACNVADRSCDIYEQQEGGEEGEGEDDEGGEEERGASMCTLSVDRLRSTLQEWLALRAHRISDNGSQNAQATTASPLPVAPIAPILRLLCAVRSALASLACVAAAGVVHADIASANALVVSDDVTLGYPLTTCVILCDFGECCIATAHPSCEIPPLGAVDATQIARDALPSTAFPLVYSQDMRCVHRARGRACTRSPESAGADFTACAAAHSASEDVWAVGCLLYELVTGVQPFSDSDPARLYLHHMRTSDTRSGEAVVAAAVATGLSVALGKRFVRSAMGLGATAEGAVALCVYLGRLLSVDARLRPTAGDAVGMLDAIVWRVCL